MTIDTDVQTAEVEVQDYQLTAITREALAHLEIEPDDILIVGFYRDRQFYPQFTDRKVITTFSQRSLYGRRLKRVFIDPGYHSVPPRELDRFMEHFNSVAWRSPELQLVWVRDN